MGKRKTTEEFIEQAKKVHGNKYDYSKVNYINNQTKICIICPEHGEFWINPKSHLHGYGCAKCTWKSRVWDKEDFVKRATIVHNGKYTYEKANYKNLGNYIIVTCPLHGDFTQNAGIHLYGCGCPICNTSKLEQELYTFLNEKLIQFEQHKTFNWLKYKSNLFLDFYIEKYNVAIECQGLQHFKGVSFGNKNTKETLEEYIKRDDIKRELCRKNGIKVLYYSNLGIEYPYEVIEDKEELLKEILK